MIALSALAACSSDEGPTRSGAGASAGQGGGGSGGASASGGTGAASGAGGGGGSQASGGSGAVGGSAGAVGSGGSAGGLGSGGTAGASGSAGQGGCPQANAPYPAGPYGGKLGSVFPNLPWAGYIVPAADAVASTKPFGDYALDGERRACKRFALVHISEFG